MKIEIRSDCAVIDGYVNAVGRDSLPITPRSRLFPDSKCVEQVVPGTFKKSLEHRSNVDLLINHDTSRKLGSTGSGELTLKEDSIGLRAHAVITDPEAIAKARNGEFRGWSFGMYVSGEEKEERAGDIPRRKLVDIDLFEVSLIDRSMQPCYAGTSVECRADGDVISETRSFEDEAEIVNNVPAPDFSEYEKRLADLRAVSDIIDAEKRLAELRYNPYHDPTNGRFTSSSGVGGSYLFVGRGQKSKGQYVFERDIDSEYEKWKAEKNNSVSDFHNRTFNNPDEFKSALAEKYNGITDVDKVKTAKDVSDFLNYRTQSQYYASTNPDASHTRKIKSTWDKRIGEIPPAYDAGFSSSGTTVIDMPKDYSNNSNKIYIDAFSELEKAGIEVGHWYDNKYMVIKKKGSRTKKWLEGTEAKRAITVADAEKQLAGLRAISDVINAEKRLALLIK